MAVEYKPGMTKPELLELAVVNGIDVDDSMTKAKIIAAIDAHNAQEAAESGGEGNIPPRTKTPGRAAQRAPRATLARAAATTPPEAVKRAHRTAQEPPKAAGRVTIPPRTKTPNRAAQRAKRTCRTGTTCSFMPGRPCPADG